MTEDTSNTDLDNQDNQDTDDGAGTLGKEHQELVERIVAERLKDMKSNVDKAYKKAEETARENARLKAAQQDANRKQLEGEGKHLEAAKITIAEQDEQIKILSGQLTSLTRDRELEKVLSPLDFRNDFARETAFNSILSSLVQDDDGAWVHKSGASLSEYVKAFAKDPNKDFLFKPKENQGSGSGGPRAGAAGQRPQSLVGMTTEELIAAAAAGKLGSLPTF